MNQGKGSDAEEWVRQILDEHPKRADAHLLAGSMLLREKEGIHVKP